MQPFPHAARIEIQLLRQLPIRVDSWVYAQLLEKLGARDPIMRNEEAWRLSRKRSFPHWTGD